MFHLGNWKELSEEVIRKEVVDNSHSNIANAK
jgi:hypothetical protein